MSAAKQAESFRLAVMAALQRRPRHQRSITWLARRLSRARSTVSRAINRGEFPSVQQAIKAVLDLNGPIS